MSRYLWVGLFIILVVVAVAIGVIVWSSYHKKHNGGGGGGGGGGGKRVWVPYSGDDVTTGDIVELTVVTGDTGASNDSGFLTILSTTLTTDCNTNRLYSNVSAFTSIGTLDSSETSGVQSVTTELASIDVQVLVDGVTALPGPITFDALAHVLTVDLDEGEFIAALETRGAAHSYDFVTRDVTPGSHTVEVQARAVATASAAPGLLASVAALIGDRTLVIQPGHVKTSTPPCPTASSFSSSSSI